MSLTSRKPGCDHEANQLVHFRKRKVAMIYYFSILISLVLVVCVGILLRLGDLVKATKDNTHEVEELRLTSRARISRVGIQSGAVTQEQKLQRLGRASIGRRIVVGGDDDSQLNHDLTVSVEKDDNE